MPAQLPPGAVRPKITRHLGKLPLIEGETVRLECMFEGYPTPQVIWSRHGYPLEDGNRYSILTTESSGHTMLTIRFTFPEDVGEYTCTVRNDAGEAVTIGHLIPEGKSLDRV